MTEPQRPGRVAEGQRNRKRLLESAARAFSGAASSSLEAIAADAGVGIGTLYRHFPSREALVAGVFHDQLQQLGDTADWLLGEHPPQEAFRLWGHRFVRWSRTKRGMADTLRALMDDGRLRSSEMRVELVAVVARFLAAGSAAGDLRSDVSAEDVAALLAGVLGIGDEDQAERLTDLVVDGLRPRDQGPGQALQAPRVGPRSV